MAVNDYVAGKGSTLLPCRDQNEKKITATPRKEGGAAQYKETNSLLSGIHHDYELAHMTEPFPDRMRSLSYGRAHDKKLLDCVQQYANRSSFTARNHRDGLFEKYQTSKSSSIANSGKAVSESHSYTPLHSQHRLSLEPQTAKRGPCALPRY